MRRQVGLFGGSFDPVHDGHLALARAARSALGLDALLWVPAGDPWQKARRLAPAEHRLAMLALALQAQAHDTVSRIEVDRAGPSYTVDTLRQLQGDAPPGDGDTDWWLVLGQDQFARLSTWRDWPQLCQRAGFAVAGRDGRAPEADPVVARAVPDLRVRPVPLPPVPVSSTALRARVAAGLGLVGMVPPAVEAYIARHGLYRNPDSPLSVPSPEPTPETPR